MTTEYQPTYKEIDPNTLQIIQYESVIRDQQNQHIRLMNMNDDLKMLVILAGIVGLLIGLSLAFWLMEMREGNGNASFNTETRSINYDR